MLRPDAKALGCIQEIEHASEIAKRGSSASAQVHVYAEARLSATLDYLTFTKASPWLESDSIPEQVLEMWRQGVRAA